MRAIPIKNQNVDRLDRFAKSKLKPEPEPESEEDEPVLNYEQDPYYELEKDSEQEEMEEDYGREMAILAVLVFAVVLLFVFKDRIKGDIIGLINKSVPGVVT